MSKSKPVGLIASGSVPGSAFARLPGLLEQLGPVKSHSLRVASRFANSIGAGRPVHDYASLEHCRVVSILVPDPELSGIVADLLAAGMEWEKRTVLLLDTWLDSSDLAPLAALGAETGSLCRAESDAETRALVEGSRVALIEAKRLLRGSGFRVFPVEPAAKPLILAALTLSETLVFPLLAAAEECLKRGGIPPKQALGILDRSTVRASRAYGISRRKAWPGPLAASNGDLMRRQMAAVAAADPATGRFLATASREALSYFERDAAWLDALLFPANGGIGSGSGEG
jgi:hypothetical protein